MRKARFVEAAREEYLAEVAFYAEAESGLGERFALAVEESTARALAFPLAGSSSPAGTRRVIVKRFPFSVIYRPETDGILVFAVAHHARRPGYWQSRLG